MTTRAEANLDAVMVAIQERAPVIWCHPDDRSEVVALVVKRGLSVIVGSNPYMAPKVDRGMLMVVGPSIGFLTGAFNVPYEPAEKRFAVVD